MSTVKTKESVVEIIDNVMVLSVDVLSPEYHTYAARLPFNENLSFVSADCHLFFDLLTIFYIKDREMVGPVVLKISCTNFFIKYRLWL